MRNCPVVSIAAALRRVRGHAVFEGFCL